MYSTVYCTVRTVCMFPMVRRYATKDSFQSRSCQPQKDNMRTDVLCGGQAAALICRRLDDERSKLRPSRFYLIRSRPSTTSSLTVNLLSAWRRLDWHFCYWRSYKAARLSRQPSAHRARYVERGFCSAPRRLIGFVRCADCSAASRSSSVA